MGSSKSCMVLVSTRGIKPSPLDTNQLVVEERWLSELALPSVSTPANTATQDAFLAIVNSGTKTYRTLELERPDPPLSQSSSPKHNSIRHAMLVLKLDYRVICRGCHV